MMSFYLQQPNKPGQQQQQQQIQPKHYEKKN